MLPSHSHNSPSPSSLPCAQDLDLKTGEPRTQPDEFWFDVAQKLMMTELQVGRGGEGL